jgi:hypothetical protein
VINKSSKNTANFTPFSSAAAEASQADQNDARRARTSEERKVVALEMIADQLALIHADLCSIDDFARANAASNGQAFVNDEGAEQDRWDNEGDGFTEDAALDPDITRSTEQHYAVGGYRYTDLQHAIAEAKRARRAAEGNGFESEHSPSAA